MAERRASVVEPVEFKRLFRWPEAGRVDRVIPKERFYAEATIRGPIRQRFVDEVRRVRWAYKLGAESIRRGATGAISEIQVFEIDLKALTLHDSVLTAIDRAIPSPIVFELRRDDGQWVEQAMAAVHNDSGANKPRASEYFRTGWVRAGDDRLPLPAALSVGALYEQLLVALLPLPLRFGEGLSEGIDRLTLVRRLTRDVSALDKRVRREPQFNRKVELRKDLRRRQAELDALTHPVARQQTTEDATWRS